MEYLERNHKIVLETMLEQMEHSFKIGRKLIDTELDAGIFNFVVRPIVKSFYSYWQSKDARQGCTQQIKLTLETAKQLIVNGHSKEDFNELIEKNFPIYLDGDQTSRSCRSTHKNYKKLLEISKDSFISQVKESITLLSVNTNSIENYQDLYKRAYETKENALKSLLKQLDFNERGIKILESDVNILKIISGKSIIVRTLRKGFDQTRNELFEDLEKNFNN